MRRLVSCLLSLPLIAVASTVPQASASPIQDVNPTPSASCPAVEVITAAGSGDAHLDDDPNFPRGFVVGTNFSKLAEERFEGVRSWQLPYYGSAGIVASNEKIGLPKFPNYAASAADGVEKVRARIDEVSAVCPETAFALAGFSQGAHVAGDVLMDLSPEQAEKVIAAYLLADPRRGSKDGATLITTNHGPIPEHHTGLLGSRPAGTFDRYEGKVRSICSQGDPACDIPPDGLLAAVGQWAQQADPEPYELTPVAAMDSMLTDGSFLLAVAPVAPRLAVALGHGDPRGVGDALRAAAGNPRLREAQRNTMNLAAHEVQDMLSYLKAKGFATHEPGATGSTAVDTAIGLVRLALDPAVAVAVPQALGMFDRHFVYRGESRTFTTIDGVRVDDWITADLTREIADYLDQPDRAVRPVPASERRGLAKLFGHGLWKVLDKVLGNRDPASQRVWERFEL